MTRFAGLLILFLISVTRGSAQSGTFQGRIVNSETGTKITYVHIWNESKKLMSISDSSGRFRINASVNDTIAIMGLGYFSKKIVAGKSSLNNELVIELQPRFYEIEEVEIVSLGSYSQFKQKFIDLNIPETKTDILRNNIFVESVKVAKEADLNRSAREAADGFSVASAPILTPEEKQYIKLKVILEKERVQKVIDRKFNRQYVADITGLKDYELDEFIMFCNFDNNYLFNAKQDEIFLRIIQKFEDFKRIKKSGVIDFPLVLG